MCLLARCYTVLIHYYFLESVISDCKLSARYVTHISDELGLIKGGYYEQKGTHVRVHVLIITNYVKYITYFKESILPN